MIGAERGHRTLGPIAGSMKGIGIGASSPERAMPEMVNLFNAMDAITDDLRDTVRRIEAAAGQRRQHVGCGGDELHMVITLCWH